ncbi:MAG TPA: hypothetical protein VMD55_03545 [Terracidiphilus sp.]|nr:hypothetical protein [Terracidiphilus sp.]
MVRSLRQGHFPGAPKMLALAAMLTAITGAATGEEPTAAAQAGFDAYVQKVEARLDVAHRRPETYLAPVDWQRVRAGEPVIENLTVKSEAELPGALIHDWRGTAFAPGATAADFERVLRDFADYPKNFAPQVEAVRVLEEDAGEDSDEDADRDAGRASVTMRVKQQHVITVVLDTDYDIRSARLDERHGTIASRSTRVAEIGADGRGLSASEEHGFLWRMNTYWSYEERDGGVYMQIESVSLTRSIPAGLGWVVGPFVESVPRESIEFTLRAVLKALKE